MADKAFLINVGDRIRSERYKKGMSQRDLAIAAECETSHLSRIENAHTAANIRTLLKLCAALEITMPELFDFLLEIGRLNARRTDLVLYLAELEGRAVGAGALSIHDGVALLAGASTRPEFRRRGAQSALLATRLEAAMDAGCDVAMMGAAPGSASQRNAERRGFRVAYTRTKWAKD